jgi:hypothetical protein
MEMEFSVDKGALPKGLKPGDRVKFEMKAGKPGDFVITKIEPVAGLKPVTGPKPVAGPKPVTPALPAPKAEEHKH